LGFLGSSLFRYQTQGSSLLDFLGFPWILSYDSRLFNGLHVINPQEIFHPAFLIETSVGTADPRFGMARNECLSGKLNAASYFLQDIAACPSAWAPPSDGQALKWVRPKDLRSYPMPPADTPLLPHLKDLLG
jgi:hypothetical protein